MKLKKKKKAPSIMPSALLIRRVTHFKKL
jgi:hypothetical protein